MHGGVVDELADGFLVAPGEEDEVERVEGEVIRGPGERVLPFRGGGHGVVFSDGIGGGTLG